MKVRATKLGATSTPSLLKMAVDAGVFFVSYVLAFQLRLDRLVSLEDTALWLTLPGVVFIKLLICMNLGCYRSVWRYMDLREFERLVLAAIVAGGVISGVGFLLPSDLAFPRSIPFIDAALTVLFGGAVRLAVRVLHESAISESWGRIIPRRIVSPRTGRRGRRALVVGAGDGGEMIVREMIRSARMDSWPVAFVDDDRGKHGHSIHGVPVRGGRESIPDLVAELDVDDILIAIPSAKGADVRRIVEHCKGVRADLKILPDLKQLSGDHVHYSDLRKIGIEDLLGRQPDDSGSIRSSNYIAGKRVLVIGAGGSIGTEICRQILAQGPTEIQLMGRGENSIYQVTSELKPEAGTVRLVQIIGDVANRQKLEGVFSVFRPQVVFHTGADKQVTLMESNADEAVFNIIVGAKNVLEVAEASSAERVVLVSTAHAVDPTSVMGCCKRVAELLVSSEESRKTTVAAVRAGNVIGSRGSIITSFERQIADGGPVLVEHREMSRHFVSRAAVASLIVQLGAIARNGQVYVLHAGDPVKLWDLAHSMVRLGGLDPARDIEIRETGLHSGEKLHERMISEHEEVSSTTHPDIDRVVGPTVDRDTLLAVIDELSKAAIAMRLPEIRMLLGRLVPEYAPPPRTRSDEARLRATNQP